MGENIGIKDIIVEVVENADKPLTISQMLTNEKLKGYSNQKISALCKQLVESGSLTRVEDKKNALFTKA